MNQFAWGEKETQFFFQLTPEKVLAAVEAAGFVCTGRCFALNSMENRVYEVEIETREESRAIDRYSRFRVVKFYRPGRWNQEQILEEHAFLRELREAEIPVIAPESFADGSTLKQLENIDIWFAVFSRVGGRSPDELDDEQVRRLGRLLARIHNVGATRAAPSRVKLTPQTYGINNLEFLLSKNVIPEDLVARFEKSVRFVCETGLKLYDGIALQRIHGDCHLGNLLWGPEGPVFLDFDDMVEGPCVQDLWLLLPGRDEEALRQREVLVEAYEQLRAFDRRSLALVEVLRGLRFVHFAAWIAKRWEDPAFPRAFPAFGSEKYWSDLTLDLEEQGRQVASARLESAR